ncbi:MAG: hypothetical protein WCE44_12340 [Candidatus Velthaea sp.]
MIVGLGSLAVLLPAVSRAQGSSPAALALASNQGAPNGYGKNGSSLSGVPEVATVVNPTAFWRELSHRAGHYNGIPEFAPTWREALTTGKTNEGNTTNHSSPNTVPITF